MSVKPIASQGHHKYYSHTHTHKSHKMIKLTDMRENNTVIYKQPNYFQAAFKHFIPICIICVTSGVLCLSPCHHQVCCKACHHKLNWSLPLCLSKC